MKAYVIKNKEGKFFCGFDGFAGINIFSERIIDGLNTQTPTLKHCREEIKDFDLKDCEPIKITIAEGDLEQQLAEKDNLIKEINQAYIETYKREREKEKEIEELKEEYDLCKSFYDLKCTEFDKLCYDYHKLRHQICEEIREKVKYSAILITDNTLTPKERKLIKDQFEFDKETIYDILRKIEKGE